MLSILTITPLTVEDPGEGSPYFYIKMRPNGPKKNPFPAGPPLISGSGWPPPLIWRSGSAVPLLFKLERSIISRAFSAALLGCEKKNDVASEKVLLLSKGFEVTIYAWKFGFMIIMVIMLREKRLLKTLLTFIALSINVDDNDVDNNDN